VKAFTFLNSLQDELCSKIQYSDIDLDDYKKVQLKVIHLNKEFQKQKKKQASTAATTKYDSKIDLNTLFKMLTAASLTNTVPNPDKAALMREGKCFYYKKSRHIKQYCLKRQKTVELKIAELEATEKQKKEKDQL
jgi:hypothetical protein